MFLLVFFLCYNVCFYFHFCKNCYYYKKHPFNSKPHPHSVNSADWAMPTQIKQAKMTYFSIKTGGCTAKAFCEFCHSSRETGPLADKRAGAQTETLMYNVWHFVFQGVSQRAEFVCFLLSSFCCFTWLPVGGRRNFFWRLLHCNFRNELLV